MPWIKNKLNEKCENEFKLEVKYLQSFPIDKIIDRLISKARFTFISILFYIVIFVYAMYSDKIYESVILLNLSLLFIIFLIIYHIESILLEIHFTILQLYNRGKLEMLKEMNESFNKEKEKK